MSTPTTRNKTPIAAMPTAISQFGDQVVRERNEVGEVTEQERAESGQEDVDLRKQAHVTDETEHERNDDPRARRHRHDIGRQCDADKPDHHHRLGSGLDGASNRARAGVHRPPVEDHRHRGDHGEPPCGRVHLHLPDSPETHSATPPDPITLAGAVTVPRRFAHRDRGRRGDRRRSRRRSGS